MQAGIQSFPSFSKKKYQGNWDANVVNHFVWFPHMFAGRLRQGTTQEKNPWKVACLWAHIETVDTRFGLKCSPKQGQVWHLPYTAKRRRYKFRGTEKYVMLNTRCAFVNNSSRKCQLFYQTFLSVTSRWQCTKEKHRWLKMQICAWTRLPCVSGVGTVTCTPSRLQRWPQGSRVTTPPVWRAVVRGKGTHSSNLQLSVAELLFLKTNKTNKKNTGLWHEHWEEKKPLNV